MGKGILTVGKLVLTNTTSNQDAVDRLRVSNPSTIFENLSVGADAKNPLLINEIVTGAATSTSVPADSYIAMATTNTGGRVVRQSKAYIVYQPGKSKMILCSGVFEISGGQAGVVSRIGAFDDEDDQVTNPLGGEGFFFELNGTTMNVVHRKDQVDTVVAQSSWNFDTFDGSGPSRITITTWDVAFLIVIDQQWLGVGQVRLGLFIDGVINYAHIFNFSSTLKLPYTRTAKLPIRYEIESVSGGVTPSEMRMMAQSVLCEGIPSSIYPQFNASVNKTVVFASVPEPLISLRLKSTFNRVTLRLVNITIFQVSGPSHVIEVLLNPTTLTGASFVSAGANSAAEIDTSATVATGGTLIGTIPIPGATVLPTTMGNSSPLFDINSDIAGTSDIITCNLSATLSGSTDPNDLVVMNWIEIS